MSSAQNKTAWPQSPVYSRDLFMDKNFAFTHSKFDSQLVGGWGKADRRGVGMGVSCLSKTLLRGFTARSEMWMRQSSKKGQAKEGSVLLEIFSKGKEWPTKCFHLFPRCLLLFCLADHGCFERAASQTHALTPWPAITVRMSIDDVSSPTAVASCASKRRQKSLPSKPNRRRTTVGGIHQDPLGKSNSDRHRL